MGDINTDADFLRKLGAGLHRCRVAGLRLMVGVSGGADSVALLRGLLELAKDFELSICVAHLNHGLRGTESDADADWVRSLCDCWQLPCDVEAAPVSEFAEQTRRGIEETAREVRYRFLNSTAERHNCDAVAVAHTADDQAETVLHHILRGTGLTGLRGMEWSRTLEHSTTSESSTRLVRPLLGIWRTEIEAYLTEVGQDFRVDVSNQDVSLTRNRLRHHLLPELERDFNPRVRQHLCHLAEQAADCDAVLRYAADRLLASTLLDRSEHVVRLRCDELTQVARSLLREVFVQLWRNQCWPSQAMTFTHWDRLAEFVQTHPPATLHLPGRLTATRRANLLMLERQP